MQNPADTDVSKAQTAPDRLSAYGHARAGRRTDIRHRRYTFDAVMMLLYMSVVYVCALEVHPLGRDYAFLESPGKLPFVADQFFAWEMRLFGAHVLPYHLVNLFILYLCMLCLYHFTRFAMRGPTWFGTLAATLFMANPVHTEAVLNLSGVGDLVACFLALASLAVYAKPGRGPVQMIAALGLFAAAGLPYDVNIGLFLVLVLFEVLCVPDQDRRLWWFPFFLAAFCLSLWVHSESITPHNLSPGGTLAPLAVVMYPIGLLPETLQQFRQTPALAWLTGCAIVAAAALIQRKAKRRDLLFGLAAMAAVRAFQGGDRIDLVHMTGGGSLLLANAMFNISLCAMFHRMMDHPKWPRPVVVLTTLLCLAFFGLQIRTNLVWRDTGRYVYEFQTEADRILQDAPGHRLGVLPDFRCYESAPMDLYESIRHDTPFSKVHDAVSLMPLHYRPGPQMQVVLLDWSPRGGMVKVEGVDLIEVVPHEYRLRDIGDTLVTESVAVQLTHRGHDWFAVSLRPITGDLPALTLPAQKKTARSE